MIERSYVYLKAVYWCNFVCFIKHYHYHTYPCCCHSRVVVAGRILNKIKQY